MSFYTLVVTICVCHVCLSVSVQAVTLNVPKIGTVLSHTSLQY